MSNSRISLEMHWEIETFVHILVHQPTFGQMYFDFAVYIYLYTYVVYNVFKRIDWGRGSLY